MSAETSSAKFMPVFFTEIVDVDHRFESGEWTEHITLFAPVAGVYTPEIESVMRSLARVASPFQVRTEGIDVFGTEEEKVLVRRVEETPQILQLQQQMQQALGELQHDPTYMHPYHPHISAVTHGSRMSIPIEGLELHIGGFSIVQRLAKDSIWTVIDKIRLKGEEAQS